MIDFAALPLYSKIILVTGFSIGFISMVMLLRYPIMLILMKISPEYREFIRKTLERNKKNRSKLR